MIRSGEIMLKVACIIAAVALCSGVAYAADAVPKIGVVNVQKLYKDTPRVKQCQESVEKLRIELATKLDIRSQNRVLDDVSIKELVDLKMKSTPTEQDNIRIKALTDSARANEDELRKLQTTAQLTDQQKARLTELSDLQKKSTAVGEQMEKDYNSQLQSKGQELEGQLEVEINEAINKVAQEKSFTYIFAKDALFVGGIDITDDVVNKLERKPE